MRLYNQRNTYSETTQHKLLHPATSDASGCLSFGQLWRACYF